MIWPLAGQTAVALHLLGQPEVGDPRVAVLVEEDVGRLEVAVDHAALVGVLDGLGDLADQPGGLARGQRTVGKALGEALPLDETHLKVMLALVLANLVDRHDAGMVEVGGRLGLAVEPLDVGLIGELAGEDHLECDGPVEADLPGLEDDPHAAAGDLADDLVVAEVADAGGRVIRGVDRGDGPWSSVA